MTAIAWTNFRVAIARRAANWTYADSHTTHLDVVAIRREAIELANVTQAWTPPCIAPVVQAQADADTSSNEVVAAFAESGRSMALSTHIKR